MSGGDDIFGIFQKSSSLKISLSVLFPADTVESVGLYKNKLRNEWNKSICSQSQLISGYKSGKKLGF